MYVACNLSKESRGLFFMDFTKEKQKEMES